MASSSSIVDSPEASVTGLVDDFKVADKNAGIAKVALHVLFNKAVKVHGLLQKLIRTGRLVRTFKPESTTDRLIYLVKQGAYKFVLHIMEDAECENIKLDDKSALTTSVKLISGIVANLGLSEEEEERIVFRADELVQKIMTAVGHKKITMAELKEFSMSAEEKEAFLEKKRKAATGGKKKRKPVVDSDEGPEEDESARKGLTRRLNKIMCAAAADSQEYQEVNSNSFLIQMFDFNMLCVVISPKTVAKLELARLTPLQAPSPLRRSRSPKVSARSFRRPTRRSPSFVCSLQRPKRRSWPSKRKLATSP